MNPTNPEDDRANVTDIREKRDAGWGVPARHVRRWPALVAILVAMALYVTLPGHLYFGPVWLLPAVEGALFVALLVARQLDDVEYRLQRWAAMGLIAAMNLANIGSLLLLIRGLVESTTVNGHPITALNLIVWSAQIWFTNLIVFALWYWELDRGGPVARCLPHHRAPDLLFPQMSNPESAPAGWTPTFFDYFYTSFTNAAAFSPTDTMPLTEWAKALFTIQALTSIVTGVLVIGRIANILH